MAYKCLKKNFLKKDDYQIIAIRREDIEDIRLWRNAQIDVLRQKSPLTFDVQQQYYETSVWPTFQQEKPSQILFSFLLDHRCIGYGGLTNLDWGYQRAEVSFLVDPCRAKCETTYQQDFTHFLSLLCQVAFEDLHLHRLWSETYAFRDLTLKILKRLGFRQEGILREHVYKGGQWIDSIVLGLLAVDWLPKKTIEEEIDFKEKNQKKNEEKDFSGVLITSISKKIPLIKSVRSATQALDQFQKIYGCDSEPSCLGQYAVDVFWNCHSLEKLNPEEVVIYCLENKIRAIIPTRDADVEFYARHLNVFREKGVFPMVSSLETISSCLDKMAFFEILQKHHFPVIPSYLSLEQFEASSYVVKERRGAGSRQLGLRLTCQEAVEHGKKLNHPVFQPFIEGREWSVDLYRSSKGLVKGCVARQRNLVVEGESQVTTTQNYPLLENLCIEMSDLLEIYGHAVFQLIEDKQGRIHVIECNPRFGGASTASVAVGLESFLWFFAECLNLNLEDYPFMRSEGEIRQVRYPADWLFRERNDTMCGGR